VLEAKRDHKKAAAYYRRAARYHLEHDPDTGQEPADYYLVLPGPGRSPAAALGLRPPSAADAPPTGLPDPCNPTRPIPEPP